MRREEVGGGLLGADLSQLPGWGRFLIYLAVVVLAAALCWGGFMAVVLVRGRL